MLIPVFILLLQHSVEAGECDPARHCLTCPDTYMYHCTSCPDGYQSKRGGAYNYCCPSECTDCNSQGMCIKCKTGRYGSLCQNVCGKGCIHSTCDQYLGLCGCRKDFSGTNCDRCTNGKYGYESNNCELACLPNCKACTSDKNCTECNDGYFGFTCEKRCPRGCYSDTCTFDNGTCYQNACKANFDGSNCKKCASGWHGEDCTLPCPGNCVSCSSKTMCVTCKEGSWGGACQSNCSHGCLEETCTKEFGICDQCKPEFAGETCTHCIAGLRGVFCNINETSLENSSSAILHVNEFHMCLSFIVLLFNCQALIAT